MTNEGNLYKLLDDLLREVDRNTCIHENVHRGGSIWTICDECGMKWADDRGGFVPYKDSPPVKAARDALECTAAMPDESPSQLPDPTAWMIVYDDDGMISETFTGCGATNAAHRRFAIAKIGFNCHLFIKVA